MRHDRWEVIGTMLHIRRRLVVGGLVAAAATAGCGPAPATSTAPSSSSSDAGGAGSGAAFSASRFKTVLPDGWTDRSHNQQETVKFSADGQVLYLAEQDPPGTIVRNVNDVTANINVVAITAPVPDDQVAAYLTSVSNHGATNVSAPRSFTIDGATGQYVTYNRDISGTPGESQDMVINHAGATFDIVFNTSQHAFTSQLAGLRAVLAAWKWAA